MKGPPVRIRKRSWHFLTNSANTTPVCELNDKHGPGIAQATETPDAMAEMFTFSQAAGEDGGSPR